LEAKEVHIDLDRWNNIAMTGVRRTAVFLGLGLNAAYNPDFKDYRLSQLPVQAGQTGIPVDFIPPDLPDDTVKHFKEQFAIWITGCGLRELLEHYALYLEDMHHVGLLILKSQGRLGKIDPAKAQKQFNRRGIPDKVDELKSRIGIELDFAAQVNSLYEARNCLTHDLGLVTYKRVAGKGELIVSWTALEILGVGEESGREYLLPALLGEKTPEGIKVIARNVERRRTFKLGEKMTLSEQDLWEICYFFSNILIPATSNKMISFLKAAGIEVKALEAVENA